MSPRCRLPQSMESALDELCLVLQPSREMIIPLVTSTNLAGTLKPCLTISGLLRCSLATLRGKQLSILHSRFRHFHHPATNDISSYSPCRVENGAHEYTYCPLTGCHLDSGKDFASCHRLASPSICLLRVVVLKSSVFVARIS